MLSLLALMLISSGVGIGTAAAQDEVDQDLLDQIRAEVPEGNPGKFDLTEASAEYGQLVALLGGSTAVENFGDGSELSGACGGFAYSYDKDGMRIDAAFDGGDGAPPVDLLSLEQAFTSSNPFKVDPRGVVTYFGFFPEVGDGPLNHKWFIKTSGISLDKGGDPNTVGNNRNAGLVDLDKDLPVKFTAKIRVEGEMNSENLGPCIGKGFVSIEGDGLTDPVGIAGLALLAGGLFGLLFNARPAVTSRG